MQSNFYTKTIITFLLAGLCSDAARAENINFNGVVLPASGNAFAAVEMPGQVVSFSDQVALGVPQGFGADGPIRITNEEGKPVERFDLLSVNSGQSRSQVVLVRLGVSQHQTFTMCDDNRCIRYQVVRY